MSEKPSRAGRRIAAVIIAVGVCAAFYNMLVDMMPKGGLRSVEGYVPWSKETLREVETARCALDETCRYRRQGIPR